MAQISTESYDSGSNYSFGDKMERPHNPRSAFNLSHLVTTTLDNCGQVQVLDIIPTLPGDDIEISVKSLYRALPSVVPPYSRQRSYIYAFYSRMSDLWNNAGTFMTKGYTGDVIKTIPVLDSTKNFSYTENEKIVAGSLADNLGLPIGVKAQSLEGFNALPLMMLLRIMRDYFTNRNYYINDRVLLPDDDTRFRLNDDGQLLSAIDEGVSFAFDICKATFDGYKVNEDTGARTFSQFCHDWPQDYFTSALPWPQRGTASTIKGTVSLQNNDVSFYMQDGDNLEKYNLRLGYSAVGDNIATGLYGLSQNTSASTRVIPIGSGNKYNLGNIALGEHTDTASANTASLVGSYNMHSTPIRIQTSDLDFVTSFTLNDLRELVVNQTELEKMARTDGSFAEFGLTFFGEKSKNAVDFRPVYIGGTYQNIQYTEVLQTSQQYETSGGSVSPVGSPLGTYGGHGICANNGYIGRVHCDEHGYIMILQCVMPDVYYSQGIDKLWTDLYQSDMFLPERAKLGLVPIKNKELFYSEDSEIDEGLWAYQNIFDQFRYIPNKVKGKIADPTSLDFFPYTQSRKFTELVNYGEDFATANNVRKDYLQAYNEVAFTCQHSFEIRAVRELPYKPIPANILN